MGKSLFNIKDLKTYPRAMTFLDIIMESKEDSWLRIINEYKIDNGEKFIVDNGAGDTLTIYITEDGAFIKGFDHENELNQFAAEEWDETFFERIYDGVPAKFLSMFASKDEHDEVTFCMLCLDESDKWMENETEGNDGGKEFLLGYICKTAEEWCEWAEDYYEISLNADIVRKIYNGEYPTSGMIKILNPARDIAEALKEITDLS